jgi:threonine dehydrogenase-like Zn-dependent dehydrogenase
MTDGIRTDVVFDAATAAPAALLWMRSVKGTGRIGLMSIYKVSAPGDLAALTYGEIDLKGTCIHTSEDFSKALFLLD